MQDIYKDLTTNIRSVANIVREADLIIIEGFESVGKFAFMTRLVKELRQVNYDNNTIVDIQTYRPSYYTLGYSKMLNIKDRYVLRLPVIEAFIQANTGRANHQLIIDKAVFSDYIYMDSAGILTEQLIHDMFEAYHLQWKDLRIAVIHVTADPDVAKAVADSEQVLIKFESAYDYLQKFYAADEAFNTAFRQYLGLYKEDNVIFVKFYNMPETQEDDTE